MRVGDIVVRGDDLDRWLALVGPLRRSKPPRVAGAWRAVRLVADRPSPWTGAAVDLTVVAQAGVLRREGAFDRIQSALPPELLRLVAGPPTAPVSAGARKRRWAVAAAAAAAVPILSRRSSRSAAGQQRGALGERDPRTPVVPSLQKVGGSGSTMPIVRRDDHRRQPPCATSSLAERATRSMLLEPPGASAAC